MLNHTASDNCKVHLYTNNKTPAKSDVLANYTEATASGYAAVSLTGSAFTIATAGGTSSAVYARQTFTFSSAENVYGYYITDNGSTTLIWAEKFAGAPFAIPSGGGSIGVDPDIRLGDCS